MGTSATTLIKRNNKVFPIGTSYDGYFTQGLGYANILCIHSFSDETLNKLFDDFNQYAKIDYKDSKTFSYYDSEYEKNERNSDYNLKSEKYSNQEIFDALKRMSKVMVNKENFEVFVKSYQTLSIPAHVGFAGVLFLGRNNHYSRDYSEPDYLVDLDKGFSSKCKAKKTSDLLVKYIDYVATIDPDTIRTVMTLDQHERMLRIFEVNMHIESSNDSVNAGPTIRLKP